MPTIYAHPPIVEAIVEFRFRSPLAMDVVEGVKAKLSKTYPFTEDLVEMSVTVGAASPSSQRKVGYRLRSIDAADVAVCQVSSLVISRTAPYLGWDDFTSKILRAYKALPKRNAPAKLSRIGVRYVNRVDIDAEEFIKNGFESYIVIGNVMPWLSSSISDLQVVVLGKNDKHSMDFRVTLASAIPVLIGTKAILIDIDVWADVDLHTRDDQILGVLERAREVKDTIFEGAITDRLREKIS